jgi:hypothetical protein
MIAETLQPVGAYAMFYLAAAVSDFYQPWSQLVRALEMCPPPLNAPMSSYAQRSPLIPRSCRRKTLAARESPTRIRTHVQSKPQRCCETHLPWVPTAHCVCSSLSRTGSALLQALNLKRAHTEQAGAQPEHKIQSRDLRSGNMSDAASTGMTVKLAPVPKMLGLLRKAWAPLAFHVSFKLETDEEILAFKVGTLTRQYPTLNSVYLSTPLRLGLSQGKALCP